MFGKSQTELLNRREMSVCNLTVDSPFLWDLAHVYCYPAAFTVIQQVSRGRIGLMKELG